MSTTIPIPTALRHFFAAFPLHTYPPIPPPSPTRTVSIPTLWISPPKPDLILPSTNLLSADVECLKWQAYIALRGIRDVGVRWDVSPDGAVDAHLPSLQTPDGKILGARTIPTWADERLHVADPDPLEGYRDEALRDESRAWVALLEGVVHSAWVLCRPTSVDWKSLITSRPSKASSSLSLHLQPPPAPLSGISSLLPPYGERVSMASIQAQYHDAILSLSERLGSDEWFLGSENPTPLDALVFAYLHCLLAGPDSVRIDVSRRANLVLWERRVYAMVQAAFAHVAGQQ